MATSSNLDKLKPQSREKITVDVTDEPVPDDDVIFIYRWLDSLAFSRSKKTSAHRDFADGVMMAELVAHYIPKIINTRNYIPTSSTAKKRANWEHLNSKVFRRVRFCLTPAMIKEVADAKPGMIERVLRPLQMILVLGPLAVIPTSKRLENVKPRFLDIPKRNLITADANDSNLNGPRPRSSSARGRSTATKSDDGTRRTSLKAKNKEDRKNSKSKPVTASTSSSSTSNDRITHTDFIGKGSNENYEIFTRPSTAQTSSEKSYPENASKAPDTADVSSELPKSPRTSPTFPYNTSWLPVESDLKNTSMSLYNKAGAEGYNDEALDSMDEESDEEVDDVIYCGNDENSRGAEFKEDVNNNAKRKIKRVVKYEYREEYILNGVTTTSASFKMPSAAELDNVRESFMCPANKDTKCRGYGFV